LDGGEQLWPWLDKTNCFELFDGCASTAGGKALDSLLNTKVAKHSS